MKKLFLLCIVLLLLTACGKRHPYIDHDYDFQFVPLSTQHNKKIIIDSMHRSLYHGRIHRFQDQGAIKIMERDGFQVTYINEKLPESLKDGQILFMAGVGQKEVRPGQWQSELSKEEVGAIVQWIRLGGGLLLLTGHDPRGSGAKNLLGALGVKYYPGYAHHPGHAGRDNQCSWFEFSINNGLTQHQLLQRKGVNIELVKFLCGSALYRRSEDIVLAMPKGTVVLQHADKKGKILHQATPLAGMIAFPFGQGRVAVVSDLGFFRNWVGKDDKGLFYVTLNDPDADNAALLVNTLRWLARL